MDTIFETFNVVGSLLNHILFFQSVKIFFFVFLLFHWCTDHWIICVRARSHTHICFGNLSRSALLLFHFVKWFRSQLKLCCAKKKPISLTPLTISWKISSQRHSDIILLINKTPFCISIGDGCWLNQIQLVWFKTQFWQKIGVRHYLIKTTLTDWDEFS